MGIEARIIEQRPDDDSRGSARTARASDRRPHRVRRDGAGISDHAAQSTGGRSCSVLLAESRDSRARRSDDYDRAVGEGVSDHVEGPKRRRRGQARDRPRHQYPAAAATSDDDPVQSQGAQRSVEAPRRRRSRLSSTCSCLMEFVWVLRSRYGLPQRRGIAGSHARPSRTSSISSSKHRKWSARRCATYRRRRLRISPTC